MTVYVDALVTYSEEQTAGLPGRDWAHLFADSPGELHAFARGLGLSRSYAQHPNDPVTFHYDVTRGKRFQALRRGAVELELHEVGELLEVRRQAVAWAAAVASGQHQVPARIQRSRAAGWRKPEGARVVTRPGPWGNPFAIGTPVRLVLPGGRLNAAERLVTRDEAVASFRYMLHADTDLTQRVCAELAGRDLCCWCALDAACHGDVLRQYANPLPPARSPDRTALTTP